jgi:hypothetical protein
MLHRRDKAVTAPVKGFDVTRSFCVVSKRFPDFVDGGVEPLIKVNESAPRPEFFAQFLSADYLTWMRD